MRTFCACRWSARELYRAIAVYDYDQRLSSIAVAIRFLAANAVLGAVVGSVFAFIVLLTDTFGIFTLIRADANPILPAFAFVIGCMTAFMPMVVATAVALADAEEESSAD